MSADAFASATAISSCFLSCRLGLPMRENRSGFAQHYSGFSATTAMKLLKMPVSPGFILADGLLYYCNTYCKQGKIPSYAVNRHD